MESFLKIEGKSTTKDKILFPLFNAISFFSAFVVDVRAGILAGVIIFFYVITHAECRRGFKDDFIFKLFYFINIASVYAYLINGRPIVIFLICITYNLFPMLMYCIGKSSIYKDNDNPVFKSILYSNFVIVLIGFIIYFVPSLAIKAGMYSMDTAGIIDGVGYRFKSYMGGSLELGSICSISLPLLLVYNFKNKIARPIMLIFFAIALLLTLQRGAWIVGIIGLTSCILISAFFNKKGLKIIFVYALLGFILIKIGLFFVDHYMSEGFLEHLMIRLQYFNSDAMSKGRSGQAENALALFLDYPFGFGLGAAGNKASAYHLSVIPDGNLIRILVETGLYGMVTFIFLNVKSILNGIKHHCYQLVVIIVLFLVHSIGSNVLDFYYSSFVYWYILGFLNRSDWQYSLANVGIYARKRYIL